MTNELAETTVQRDEWKRIAEDRGIELERLRADISQAYDLRDKAEGRYCTALGAIEQLHAAVKTAQELAARRLMEIDRLKKREKDLMDVIDSRDRALGFVPLDEVHASRTGEAIVTNEQLIAIEMKPLEGCAAVLVSFNRPFTHVEMNAMHRALNEHLIPHDNEPGVVTRLPVPGTQMTRLSDIADELIRQLRKQGMEKMQAVFDGMRLRIDPWPEQPPVDNDHVAEGCEKFDE